jgi:hypothetical protein
VAELQHDFGCKGRGGKYRHEQQDAEQAEQSFHRIFSFTEMVGTPGKPGRRVTVRERPGGIFPLSAVKPDYALITTGRQFPMAFVQPRFPFPACGSPQRALHEAHPERQVREVPRLRLDKPESPVPVLQFDLIGDDPDSDVTAAKPSGLRQDM